MLELFLEYKVLLFITVVVTINFVLFILRIWITVRMARRQQQQFRAEIMASEDRMQKVFSQLSQTRLDIVGDMERIVKKMERPDDNADAR